MEITMRLHMKTETEPIFTTLDRYRAELQEHPLLEAARAGKIERTTLLEPAYDQYSDSITWIPMLAQMKARALRSRRLRQAIEDNIAHEAAGRVHAGAETLEDPDALWRSRCASH